MSKLIKVLTLPRCTLLYTVGPQTYIPTNPSTMGLNSSFFPVKEF
jgi:hypothetical protein